MSSFILSVNYHNKLKYWDEKKTLKIYARILQEKFDQNLFGSSCHAAFRDYPVDPSDQLSTNFNFVSLTEPMFCYEPIPN